MALFLKFQSAEKPFTGSLMKLEKTTTLATWWKSFRSLHADMIKDSDDKKKCTNLQQLSHLQLQLQIKPFLA